jgi:hypothetical protein
MPVALIIQILEALASIIGQIMPLITQGEAVLSQTDAQAIHDALAKAEAATATLRPQVDAALTAAAAQ